MGTKFKSYHGEEFTFAKIEDVPSNYVVWNVPFDCLPLKNYVPMCKMLSDVYIDTKNMLAVYVSNKRDEIMKLAAEVRVSIEDVKKIMRYDRQNQ